MQEDFWHERWNNNQINFHQGRPNAMLEQHYAAAGLGDCKSVLVPLCGKAVDMTWLREQGHHVLGVELSPIAVRDYFRDRGESYDVDDGAPFEKLSSDGITLLCGDFFALDTTTANQHGGVHGIYDRAALVALPPDMRERYVHKLLDVLPPGAPVLLITFDYDQAEMNGPPFSVPEAAVRALFEPSRQVELLGTQDVLAKAQPLRDRGLTALNELAFLIR